LLRNALTLCPNYIEILNCRRQPMFEKQKAQRRLNRWKDECMTISNVEALRDDPPIGVSRYVPLLIVFQVLSMALIGCELIIWPKCDDLRIPNGKIVGEWRGLPAVVSCNDGYEYKGEPMECYDYDHCSMEAFENKRCLGTMVYLPTAAKSKHPKQANASKMMGRMGKGGAQRKTITTSWSLAELEDWMSKVNCSEKNASNASKGEAKQKSKGRRKQGSSEALRSADRLKIETKSKRIPATSEEKGKGGGKSHHRRPKGEGESSTKEKRRAAATEVKSKRAEVPELSQGSKDAVASLREARHEQKFNQHFPLTGSSAKTAPGLNLHAVDSSLVIICAAASGLLILSFSVRRCLKSGRIEGLSAQGHA
jgi:hypothetical protein